ncbi:immunity 49 family protein [Streptomyces sp. NPDC048639]|uniref:immunity 49 family protein n=1 Tax=Streptomyces sp. NPDC048639 TaxID=3365581 RepID=UPI00371742D7
MVTSVARHGYPTDVASDGLASLDKTADWVLKRIEGSEVARTQALDTMLALATSRCATDTEAVQFETWEAWIMAMQTGSALFAAATAAEGTSVTCRIREQEKIIPATGAQPHVNAGTWITAFYLAMICRENERLKQLADVPVSLLRDSGAVFDEYIYSWVETLQSFWLGRQDIGDKLVAAVDGTAPEAARQSDAELMSKILYPPIILFYRYLRQDHEQFNIALSDALRWHKDYWSATEDRAMSSDGLVALGPLAIACLARDQGFPIEIESEYLPKALLEYAWVDEIGT